MARRRWQFDLDDGHHVVELDHGYFLGTRKLTVDGVKATQRGRPFMDHSGVYPFRVGTRQAELRISTDGIRYFYDVTVDGRSVASGQPAGLPRPPFGGPRQRRLLGLVFLIMGVPLLAVGARFAYDEYRYRAASDVAAATVRSKRIVSGRSTSYKLAYDFRDRSGAMRNGEDDVSRAIYDETRIGDRYVVRYVSEDPSVNRFEGRDGALNVAVFVSLGVVALAYAVWLFVGAARRIASLRRIADAGQPAMAEVTKVRRQYMRGSGQVVQVEYEYTDPYGVRRRGRGPFMYPNEGDRYARGSSIRVLVDPDRPGESALAESPS